MSVCTPGDPNACEDCKAYHQTQRTVTLTPRDGRPAGKSQSEQQRLEKMVEDLKKLRQEVRQLTRSGHPGVRAEALSALARAEQDIRWLKDRMGKQR